jgi:hypothetical protein
LLTVFPEIDVGAAPKDGCVSDSKRRTDVTDCIPPQTDEIATELDEGRGRLLHCLDCGRQLVALRHGGSCLLCGSAAVVVEDP